MKKVFGISLVGLFAVAPLVATADPVAGAPESLASTATAAQQSAVIADADPLWKLVEADTTNDNNAASAGYVKGAYNAAIQAVNYVHEEVEDVKAGAAAGATAIQAGGNGIAQSGTTLSADLTDKGGLEFTGDTEGSKKISVKVDGSTIEKNTSSGALQVKDGGVSFAKMASGAVATSVAATGSTSAQKLTTETAVRSAITTATSGMVTASSTNTFTNKTIDAEGTGNSISNLKTSNFKTGTIVTSVGATGADTSLPTEKAVRSAITTATSGMVTTTGTQTLTNKTINAANNTISGLGTGNFGSGVVVTSVGATGSDTALPTEKAVRSAITTATTDMATNTSVSGTYAKKDGVDKTIKAVTLNQGAVTQGLSGSLGTGTVVTVMTKWNDHTQKVNKSGVTGIGTLNTSVSVAKPTIDATSVSYTTANAS